MLMHEKSCLIAIMKAVAVQDYIYPMWTRLCIKEVGSHLERDSGSVCMLHKSIVKARLYKCTQKYTKSVLHNRNMFKRVIKLQHHH